MGSGMYATQQHPQKKGERKIRKGSRDGGRKRWSKEKEAEEDDEDKEMNEHTAMRERWVREDG